MQRLSASSQASRGPMACGGTAARYRLGRCRPAAIRPGGDPSERRIEPGRARPQQPVRDDRDDAIDLVRKGDREGTHAVETADMAGRQFAGLTGLRHHAHAAPLQADEIVLALRMADMGRRANDLMRRGGKGGKAEIVEFGTGDVAREAPAAGIARRDVEHGLADGVVPVGELLARPDGVGRPALAGHGGAQPRARSFSVAHPRPRPDALRTKTRRGEYGG